MLPQFTQNWNQIFLYKHQRGLLNVIVCLLTPRVWETGEPKIGEKKPLSCSSLSKAVSLLSSPQGQLKCDRHHSSQHSKLSDAIIWEKMPHLPLLFIRQSLEVPLLCRSMPSKYGKDRSLQPHRCPNLSICKYAKGTETYNQFSSVMAKKTIYLFQ